MKYRATISNAILVSLLILAVGIGFLTGKYFYPGKTSKYEIQGLLWPNPKVIGNFSLVDHEGNLFGPEKLQGKWSFLFFGYTHCPDVCPITLSMLNQVYNKLHGEQQGNDLQILFVSVDAERDTPEQLRNYIDYFNPEFIGLGGNTSQIESISRQIGIAYYFGEKDGSDEYTVDHTASVFLVDPERRLVGIYSAPHNTDDIVSRYVQIKNLIQEQG